MFDIQETTNNANCSFTTKLEDKNVVDIGSDVTLSCCLDKKYRVRWYKDQCELSMNDKFNEFKDERGEHKLIIADIQEEDSGVYSCGSGTTKTSCKLNVADCSFTTTLDDINVIGIGSDVSLSCCLDKEYGVRWYKDKDELSLNDKFKFKDERWKHNLIIAGIQEEDSGVYSCHCGTTKTSCKLNVEDCSFTTKLEDRNVVGIGSDVTLSCCLDKEYGVQWYKDQSEISMNDKFKFKDERWKHQLIIADIQEEDSSVYSCECGTTKTSCILKVEARLFIKQLKDVTITKGEELILACELKAECKEVQWCKTNGVLSYRAITTHRKIAGSNAHRYQLEIHLVKVEDAGEYKCYCHENDTTTCNVMVKEIEEIQIDASINTTTMLCELDSTKEQLKVTKGELLKTGTEFKNAATDVKQKEIIIKEREKEIAELRAVMQKIKESEIENKEDYIKELENKNQQLAESVKSLESKYKELEIIKDKSAQMKEQIDKLVDEKQHLKKKVRTLELYINDKESQHQKVLEEIRTMIQKKKKSIVCSVL